MRTEDRTMQARRGRRLRRLAAAMVAVGLIALPGLAGATQPRDPATRHGRADVAIDGKTMTIAQEGPVAKVDWTSFSIAKGFAVVPDRGKSRMPLTARLAVACEQARAAVDRRNCDAESRIAPPAPGTASVPRDGGLRLPSGAMAASR
ncbi:hypothetical protein [Mitsuaria sp. GD03876]|uniref:hypothetical protein n=1 Tax=Mitsuaria sp. GD03876 TaxID=2975399 RepID=UPI00244BCAB1|nr:hypothetical protein [Mitsuaria sp. GD03876]MDH0866248.1 hypothetical protein [Mitsuaria sp. GD03876]